MTPNPCPTFGSEKILAPGTAATKAREREQENFRADIPTGIPLVYELDPELRPIREYYLGDREAAARKAAAVANQDSVRR